MQGVLRIHIKAARDLENKDTFMRGKSDPYANLSGTFSNYLLSFRKTLFVVFPLVGVQNYKTKVIDNNLNPIWDEYFEAVVDQSSGQRILLECFDQDPGSNDEILGRISLDISMIRDKIVVDQVLEINRKTNCIMFEDAFLFVAYSAPFFAYMISNVLLFQWFPLEGVKHGEVHLAMYWLDLSTDLKLLGHQDEWEKPFLNQNQSQKNLSDAVLLVYVDNVSNLPVNFTDTVFF